MRELRKTAVGIAAVALAAGVIAGCGSSSSDTASSAADQVESVASEATSTTAELTQAEYVAQANAICARIDDATSTLSDDADTDSAAEAAARAGVAELKALVPPAAQATAHATLVETSGAAIDLAVKIISAFDSGNLDEAALAADAQEATALKEQLSAAVEELGLSDCFSAD